MKIIQRFTALMLSVMMLATSYTPVIASSQNLDSYLVDDTNTESILYTEEQLSNLDSNFYAIDEYDNSYNDEDIQTRSLWDVVDVVMAGISWADFLNDPSLGNFGWAVLDTAALLPFLPSSAYFRKAGKTFIKKSELAKFIKKSTRNKNLVKKFIKGYKLASPILENNQLIKKVKHAPIYGLKNSNDKKNIERFRKAILSVINNATEVYLTTHSGQSGKVILYYRKGKAVFLDMKGKFITTYELTPKQLNFHRSKLRIK